MKYLIVLLVVLLGCGTKNESIVGSYSSEGQTFFSNIASVFSKNHRAYRAVGLKLQINSDSSFIEYRCQTKIEGKWNVVNDTLFLKSEKYYFFDDSTNIKDEKIEEENISFRSRNKLMKYEIKPTSLEKITINEKRKKILTKYIKTE